MTNEQANQILRELEMLRKLKMLELVEKGFSQSQIADALGVSQPTVSRMFPRKDKKKKAPLNE